MYLIKCAIEKLVSISYLTYRTLDLQRTKNGHAKRGASHVKTNESTRKSVSYSHSFIFRINDCMNQIFVYFRLFWRARRRVSLLGENLPFRCDWRYSVIKANSKKRWLGYYLGGKLYPGFQKRYIGLLEKIHIKIIYEIECATYYFPY